MICAIFITQNGLSTSLFYNFDSQVIRTGLWSKGKFI
jgi:hypothetical protein